MDRPINIKNTVFVSEESSTFDKKMAMAKKLYQNRYENDERMVQLKLTDFENKLRPEQAKQDISLMLNNAMESTDPYDWSYGNYASNIRNMLTTSSYGSRGFTPDEVHELVSHADTLWTQQNEVWQKTTIEAYNNVLLPQIQEIEQRAINNPNNLPTKAEIEAIYANFERMEGVSTKFIIDKYYSDLQLANGLERKRKAQEFVRLHRDAAYSETHDEYEYYMELNDLFTTEEKAQFLQANQAANKFLINAETEAKTAQKLNFAAPGTDDSDIVAQHRADIISGKYDNLTETELKEKLAGDTSKITMDSWNSLSQELSVRNAIVTNDQKVLNERFTEDFYAAANNGYEGFDLETAFEKYQIPESLRAGFREIYENDSLHAVYNEMYQLTSVELADFDIDEAMKKHDLNPQEFAQAKQTMLNQQEALVSKKVADYLEFYNLEGNITKEDVDRVAYSMNLINDNGKVKAEYAGILKPYYDNAKTDRDDRIKSESRGHAGESDGQTATMINNAIADYRNGDLNEDELYRTLNNNSDKLTLDEYESLFSDIGVVINQGIAADNASFNANVLDPFLRDKESWMPGDVDKLIEEHGIDVAQYDSQIATIREQARLNQHNANASEYQNAQMYIALRKQYFSHEDIKDMGYWVPTFDAEYRKANPEISDPLQYAQSITSGLSELLLPDRKKDIDTLAEDIAKDTYDDVMARLTGSDKDYPTSVAKLEAAKLTMTQDMFRKYLQGFKNTLTPETYDEYWAEDLSKYNNPQNEQDIIMKRQTEDFERHIRDQLGIKNEDGDKLSAFAIDNVISSGVAMFIEMVRNKQEATGRMLNEAEIEIIRQNAYTQIIDTKYVQDTDGFFEFISKPLDFLSSKELIEGGPNDMGRRLFEVTTGGVTPFYDQTVVNRVLSDATSPVGEYRKDNSKFGEWATQLNSGTISHEQIGYDILYTVARNLVSSEGMPDPDSDNFESDLEDWFEGLPVMARNSVVDATADIKALLYASADMIKGLGEDVVEEMGGNPMPVIKNNTIGIEVGGETILGYLNDEGTIGFMAYNNKTDPKNPTVSTFDVTTKEIDASKANITKKIGNRLSLIGSPATYLNTEASLTDENVDKAVESYMEIAQGELDSIIKSGDLSSLLNEYTVMNNKHIQDVNNLTNKNNLLYRNPTITINEEKVRSYITHYGTTTSEDLDILSDFIDITFEKADPKKDRAAADDARQEAANKAKYDFSIRRNL
jgi:hypothetical protein